MIRAHLRGGQSSIGPAVVTGAGSGIGRAVALRLAGMGVPLALVDCSRAALEEVVRSAHVAGASDVIPLLADIAQYDEIERAFEQAADRLGFFRSVVNAAGVLVPGSLDETTEENWQRHMSVNASGVFHCLRSASTRLAESASVVVVSSNTARVPRTGMLAYAASKAAASALARCAGLELATRGVRCNVVEPGSTDTPMQRDLWPDVARGREAALNGDPGAYRVGIPLRRIASPDDVASVVVFLLTPDARHVTLQQIYVDGGASL